MLAEKKQICVTFQVSEVAWWWVIRETFQKHLAVGVGKGKNCSEFVPTISFIVSLGKCQVSSQDRAKWR